MSKLTVKVCPETSKVLQELAINNGYTWYSGGKEVWNTKDHVLYLVFEDIGFTIIGHNVTLSEYEQIDDLEEAIKFITKPRKPKPKIKRYGNGIHIKKVISSFGSVFPINTYLFTKENESVSFSEKFLIEAISFVKRDNHAHALVLDGTKGRISLGCGHLFWEELEEAIEDLK